MTQLQQIDFTSREVIETLKATVAKGATDAQLAQFIEVCRATGLNPFLKEIWCIAATNTIMTSRDGYLKIANNDPAFDGIESEVVRDDKGQIQKAICTIWRKDRSHPTKCEAWFNEYFKTNSQVWKQYPSAMIMKVAEALALKRSFAINGLVTQEEIGDAPAFAPDAVTVLPPAPKPAPSREAAVAAVKDEIRAFLKDPEPIPTPQIQELKEKLKSLAAVSGRDLDTVTCEIFEVDLGKMNFAKLDKLRTDKQLERVAKANATADLILATLPETII